MGSPNIKVVNPYLLTTADRQISVLKSKILPVEPYLLLVEDQTPHLRLDPYQYRGTPFEPYEVRHLQYLTMVSDENRGLAHPQGDWYDEIESCSPAAIARQVQSPLSSAKESKIPSKKMSIADYKKMRQEAISKANANAKTKSESSNTPSSEPMIRNLSGENVPDSKLSKPGLKVIDAKEILMAQLADFKAEARSAVRLSNPPHTNGNKSKNENVHQSAKSLLDPHQKPSLLSPIKTHTKHAISPQLQSPRRNGGKNSVSTGRNKPKRPLELSSTQVQQVQKRQKTKETTPPLSVQSSILRRSENHNELKVSPTPSKVSAKSPPSPLVPKKVATAKAISTKSSTLELIPIPPLLSPLPADLDDLPESVLQASPKIKNHPPITKNSNKAHSKASEDNHTKKKLPSPKPDNRRASLSPVFVHPPLLSPDLPPIVERELARLQKKSSALNSAEVRNEQPHQSDSPDAARKTVPNDELSPRKSMDSNNGKNDGASELKKKLLVKIKYKKRRAKDIERILRMTPKVQSARFQEHEAVRLAALKGKTSAKEERTTSKGEKSAPNSETLSSTPKKRNSENFDGPSPTIKRAKVNNIDSVQSPACLETPFRSPATTSVPLRRNMSTPKKADSKGITMRKIPSSDDAHVHTPGISTPASVDKRSITSNVGAVNPQIRPNAARYVSEALSLKRKMDSELKTKDIKARKNLSDREIQAGLCTGIECLLAYYSGFSLKKESRPIDRANSWESTLGLLEFVVRTAEPFLPLQTLAAQINALAREELNRSYFEHVAIFKEAPSELLEKIVRNVQNRDRYWTVSNKGREVLRGLGISDTVGPWTSWRSGREYFLGALEKYEEKVKLGWKPTLD